MNSGQWLLLIIMSIVVAHFPTKDEKMTDNKSIRILVGFSGVVVMLGYEALWEIGGRVF